MNDECTGTTHVYTSTPIATIPAVLGAWSMVVVDLNLYQGTTSCIHVPQWKSVATTRYITVHRLLPLEAALTSGGFDIQLADLTINFQMPPITGMLPM